MHASSRHRCFASALVALGTLASSCSSPAPGTTAVPVLDSLADGQSVRNIVVTQYAGSAQAAEPAACTLEADLFDVVMSGSLAASAMDGNCTLYPEGSSLPLDAQTAICAGAIIATYGGRSENLAYCPSAGVPFRRIGSIGCGGLEAGTTVALSSLNEIDGDVLTDLSVQVAMPGALSITAPTDLGVMTWPASGALDVSWTSENASSAVVVIEARGNPMVAPRIVCRPGADHAVNVSATLLDQGNFRTQESMVRVFSYRDATTTAEGSHEYHVWGAIEATVLMQAMQ